MKTYREAAEGITRRNGDVVLTKDDITALDTFWSSLGFRSTAQERTGRLRGMMYEYEQAYKTASTRIKRQYVDAAKSGDSAGMLEARQAWRRVQESKKRNGFKPSPLSDLTAAPKQQRTREKKYQKQLQDFGL